MLEDIKIERLGHYDYKPLLIEIFDMDSNHMKNLLIDGTQFNACVALAEENRKKIHGKYFEIRSRTEDKVLYTSLNK